MKILWLTNILPQFLAEKINEVTIHNLGWLDYTAHMLIRTKAVQLLIVFPSNKIRDNTYEDIRYYTFPEKYKLHRNDEILGKRFINILKKEQPDIIHIHGTEYYHSIAMVKAAQKCEFLKRVVISIQGLVSVYALHYMAELPESVRRRYTIHDLIKRENLYKQQKLYEERGKAEKEALKMVYHVIGRTEWDKACIKQINPMCSYHFCNETLRASFYSGQWDVDHCEKHSVFVSQATYPIKGMHQVLDSAKILLDTYPDLKIYVTGQDVLKKAWYRINSYHAYLKEKIVQLGLKDHVFYLGILNETQMHQQYLKSNVFVLASSIENSPNSLGEAMILGVPSIASDVGGVSDIFTRNIDGYMYPFDEPYMLAYYIEKCFNDTEEIRRITKNARRHALDTHDPMNNLKKLLSIYRKICENK